MIPLSSYSLLQNVCQAISRLCNHDATLEDPHCQEGSLRATGELTVRKERTNEDTEMPTNSTTIVNMVIEKTSSCGVSKVAQYDIHQQQSETSSTLSRSGVVAMIEIELVDDDEESEASSGSTIYSYENDEWWPTIEFEETQDDSSRSPNSRKCIQKKQLLLPSGIVGTTSDQHKAPPRQSHLDYRKSEDYECLDFRRCNQMMMKKDYNEELVQAGKQLKSARGINKSSTSTSKLEMFQKRDRAIALKRKEEIWRARSQRKFEYSPKNERLYRGQSKKLEMFSSSSSVLSTTYGDVQHHDHHSYVEKFKSNHEEEIAMKRTRGRDEIARAARDQRRGGTAGTMVADKCDMTNKKSAEIALESNSQQQGRTLATASKSSMKEMMKRRCNRSRKNELSAQKHKEEMIARARDNYYDSRNDVNTVSLPSDLDSSVSSSISLKSSRTASSSLHGKARSELMRRDQEYAMKRKIAIAKARSKERRVLPHRQVQKRKTTNANAYYHQSMSLYAKALLHPESVFIANV
jgi:hypothetical protein